MSEKEFARDEGSQAAPLLEFQVMPPLRCSHVYENPDRNFCGALASYMRAATVSDGFRFVCEQHREASDVAIAGELAIRVVSLHVEILFAGVVPFPRIAEVEALMRLHAAVADVGGLVNLVAAGSELGRWTPPRPADVGRGGSGRGE